MRAVRVASAAVLALSACADLGTEAARVPASLELDRSTVLTTEGETVSMGVRLLDEDGRPFEMLPAWAQPTWTVTSGGVLETDGSVVRAVHSGEGHATVSLAGRSATAAVRVNPREMVLRVERFYLTQSTQRADGTVPLVEGRDALLRVFLSGDRANFFRPGVRATLYRDGEVVQTLTLHAQDDSVPQQVAEAHLGRSWNAAIAASDVRPGLAVAVEVEPEGVPLAEGSRTRVPESGALALDVRSVPVFRLRVVPIRLNRSGTRTALLPGAVDQLTRPTFARFPLSRLEADLHVTYATDADVTRAEGWIELLSEIAALRVAEGSDRDYYGMLPRTIGSPFAGLGYLGGPAAIGDDDPETRAETMAHELGHNFGLPHAPCGDPASPDPDFPYPEGGIGVFGYDLLQREVEDPAERKDLMSYCRPVWISDYNYEKVLAFRDTFQLGSEAARADEPAEPVLLVWGAVAGGRIVLEPSFEIEARPRLPGGRGPYRLTGYDAAGDVLFTRAFDAPRTDHEPGRAFAFAIPARLARTERLERLEVVGPEGRTERHRVPLGARPWVAVRRGPGEATVSWRAPGSPMALVRDARTGEILSFARRGTASLAAPAGSVELLVSDGVRSVRTTGIPLR